MRVGILGCGNIGRFLLESINVNGYIPDCRIEAAYDSNQDKFGELTNMYGVRMFADMTALLDTDVDLIIEAATAEAVKEHAVRILEKGKKLVIISVGALVDSAFYDLLQETCKTYGTQIYLPSGAIGGLDILKAASSAKQLESVTITTRKPANALVEEPLSQEKVLYEGSAEEAIVLFPKNVNVSIILSLVGLGPKRTTIRIIADPNVTKNNHYIEAVGAFGTLKLHLENDPMPSNPKTSYLAALSILSTLKNQSQLIHIG